MPEDSRPMTSADPFPSKTAGKLRLYSNVFCPFALRSRLILARKRIEYETININLKDKPQWFLDKYPVGTVPVMEIDEKLIGGSLAISEYLDEVYAENGFRLLSADPYEKGRVHMLIDDKFSKAISAVFQCTGRKENWEEFVSKHIGELEKILESSKFLAAEEITYADYMIWPFLRKLAPHIGTVIPTGKFPNLERWIKDMAEDDAVKECRSQPEAPKM